MALTQENNTQDPSEICLVNTPSPFLADEKVFASLGILKLAACLEKRHIPVDVMDLAGIGNYPDVIAEYMKQIGRARVVGITATTPQFPEAVKVLQTIKKIDPDTKVILGGAHPTMVNSAYDLDRSKKVRHRGTQAYEQMMALFDVVVAGDGEQAIFEAIKPEATGLIDAGNRKSPLFLQKGTLENYPLPARHLIDFDSYHYQIDGVEAQSMIAQLGCPFECGFCGGRNTASYRMARQRSTESVMEEVEELVLKYGKNGIMLYDDELNINHNGMMGLMGELIKFQEKTGRKLHLRGFVKAELFNKEQAEIMKRAGFSVLLTGVESGDDDILTVMKKHTSREINSKLVEVCHQAEIKVKALMSLGHPGETEQSVENTRQWLLANLKPGDDFDVTIIQQYPGSPYFDESYPHPTEEGVWVYQERISKAILYSKGINHAEQAGNYKGVPGDYTSYVWTDQLPAAKLVELRDEVDQDVRQALGIAPIQSISAQMFEHSMGQSRLPQSILRSSR